MPRVCTKVTLPDGTVALVTTSSSVNPNDPCDFCVKTKTQQPRVHQALCDFPIHKGKDTKRYTCSKRLCNECKYPLGIRVDKGDGVEISSDLDLCPIHAVFVHQHQLEARLLPLLKQTDLASHRVALDLVNQHQLSALSARPSTDRKFMPKGLVDWHEFYTERAAVYEYEAGMPRDEAERRARADAGPRPNPTPEKKGNRR
jgi:hypothetical protein